MTINRKMLKLTGARLGDLAHRAKGHLRTAYHSAVKFGGHLDNIMSAGRIASGILAPHISEGAQKAIGGGLSKYEQVRDQVRGRHDTALQVAADIRSKALPVAGL